MQAGQPLQNANQASQGVVTRLANIVNVNKETQSPKPYQEFTCSESCQATGTNFEAEQMDTQSNDPNNEPPQKQVDVVATNLEQVAPDTVN